MPWIKPSDAASLYKCPRRLWYEHNPPLGVEAVAPSPFDAMLIEMGNDHEKKIKNSFSQTGPVITATSAEHSQQLMYDGAAVIYQAQLVDTANQLIGFPDFLIRQTDGRYQAADAKLARSVDKEIRIQLGFYRKLLGNDLPSLVYLGTGEIAEIGDEANAEVSTYIAEVKPVLESTEPPLVRYSDSKCGACPFFVVCKPQFIEKDELTLVYGVESRAAPGLERQGITTIAALAQADPEQIEDVPYLKGYEKKKRAVLQAKAYKTGEMYKMKDITLPGGTWVHFDIESNSMTPDGKNHVYLWGLLKPEYQKNYFDYVWTDSYEQDRQGWEAFLKKVEEYRALWPDIRLIHYATFERDNIVAYAKRYAMQDHPTVIWLLDEENGPLFDLRLPVIESLVLPLMGYGLKAICKHEKLVDFQWEDDGSGSQWSVVQYVNFINETVPAKKEQIKQSILTYNRDDVIATRRLEEWLRSL